MEENSPNHKQGTALIKMKEFNSETGCTVERTETEFKEAEQSGTTINLNIAGVHHQVPLSTLWRFPSTKLARLADYHQRKINNGCDDEALSTNYYFNRHPGVFQSIIDFYRTGELHYPSDICGVIAKREFKFWEVSDQTMEACCITNYVSASGNLDILSRFKRKHIKLDKAPEPVDEDEVKTCKMKVWTILDDPKQNWPAMIYATVSYLIVMGNIVGLCVETMEVGEVATNVSYTCNGRDEYVIVRHPISSLRYVDMACAVFFTIELLFRLLFCPNKSRFVRHPLTILDAVALIPTYAHLAMTYSSPDYCVIKYNRVLATVMTLRILRVFRLFHLLRHYNPFLIFVYSIRISFREFFMLIVFMGVAVLFFGTLIYQAEQSELYDTKSEMYPDAFAGLWWALITMTTVGYGDKYPITGAGYIVGSFVALSGVLIVALAVPIIANNFTLLYDFYAASEKLGEKEKELGEHAEKKGCSSCCGRYKPVQTNFETNV
ncbi:potassium voltage-gated channel subfamily C member 3-like isoform X2 [Lineus longissimus]|uniref:potassium voltage-gated channel subfamily C member 3-like isoform X2 n=1 Tax=Lineus longissimus TaxID=88925 RepID=UPI00315D99A8